MVYLRFEMLQTVLADFKKSHTENFIGGANKLTIIRAEALGELCESGSGTVQSKLSQVDPKTSFILGGYKIAVPRYEKRLKNL